MAKCTLKILFDRAGRDYLAGQKVTGGVEVLANEDCECRALTLAHVWRTHGQGETDIGGAQKQILGSGIWHAGETVRFPFEFVAPPGPLSYYGVVFSVVWRLRANADIAGALDTSAEEEFKLGAAESPPAFNLGPAFRGVESHQQLMQLGQTLKQGCLVMLGLAFFLVAAGLGAHVRDLFRRASTPGPQEWSGLLVWVLFTGGAVALVVWGLRPLIARRKIGPVSIEVKPEIVRLGGSVACLVSFRPRADVELVRATATLRAIEIISWQHGEDSHTRRSVVSERSVVLAPGRRLLAGEPVALEATLEIPAQGPSTFMAAHNSLLWMLNVCAKLGRWPDWRHEVPVTVRP
jgi:hypothetical protein